MENILRPELERGLEYTDSPMGISKQIGRCLQLALGTMEHHNHGLIVKQLWRTVDVLEVVRSSRRRGFDGEDVIQIRVASPANPNSWEDWFRKTHWSITHKLECGPDERRLQEVALIISQLEKIIKVLEAWTKGYEDLVKLIHDWFFVV